MLENQSKVKVIKLVHELTKDVIVGILNDGRFYPNNIGVLQFYNVSDTKSGNGRPLVTSLVDDTSQFYFHETIEKQYDSDSTL